MNERHVPPSGENFVPSSVQYPHYKEFTTNIFNPNTMKIAQLLRCVQTKSASTQKFQQ